MNFKLFGLDNRDKRVYETLLKSPDSSIRTIAEQTGINRGSVFESIKNLQSVGLVAYVQIGERKKYSAEDPEKLHEFINERRRILRDAHEDVDLYSLSLVRPDTADSKIARFATFYEGDEGVTNVLRDVLTTCRVQHVSEYRVISSPRVSEYMYNNFSHYTKERVKQGLYVRILRQGAPLRGEAEVSERRYLDNQSDSGSYTLIYGTKLAIISIDDLNYLSAVVIDNAGVSSAHAIVFDQAWRSAFVA
jgi:HTH-type transcriptional regulator, sugar sensing transcriptional regulator